MENQRVNCPDCSLFMDEYEDGDWLIWICWECGYFKSNSPGYKLSPDPNIIRENPQKFIKKYLYHPTCNTQDKHHDNQQSLQ